jgi:hypothetical protein
MIGGCKQRFFSNQRKVVAIDYASHCCVPGCTVGSL